MSTTSAVRPSPVLQHRTPAWRVPLLLVAFSLVPVIAGSLRLTDLATGSTLMPEDAHPPAMPVALVVHITGAVGYSVLGASQFSSFLSAWLSQHPRSG